MKQSARLAAIDSLGPRFRDRARALDEAESFPYENFKELAQAGLLNLTLAGKWGGQGLWSGDRYVAYYEVLERLAIYDSSTAQLLQVHSHALGILSLLATEEAGNQVPHTDRGIGPARRLGRQRVQASRGGQRHIRVRTCAAAGRGLDAHLREALRVAGPGRGLADDLGRGPRRRRLRRPDRRPAGATDAPEVELIDEWDVMGMRSTVSWA